MIEPCAPTPLMLRQPAVSQNHLAFVYAGDLWLADGRFHAAWIDNRSGVQQVWTAALTVPVFAFCPFTFPADAASRESRAHA